jgi:hypothetical protein
MIFERVKVEGEVIVAACIVNSDFNPKIVRFTSNGVLSVKIIKILSS